ncbi:MAG: cyclic nucleotide-binding domain-containing protein [Acidimicrobiales bacterium]
MFGRNNKLDTSWLAKVGFFAGFSDDELRKVADLGQKVEVSAGSNLTDQGRVGDVSYVIVSGMATVRIRGEYVTTVGPGTMVGEMALIEHRPRAATVTADTPMELVSFDTDHFRKLLQASPTTHDRVMAMLHDRLEENEALG